MGDQMARSCLTAALLWLSVSGCWVQAQVNDDWATRTTILALPFSVNETLASQSTVNPSDPPPPCPAGSSNPFAHTLWYSYTAGAATEYLTLTIPGSIIGSIGVYTGVPGAFRVVSGGCSSRGDTGSDIPRIVGLRLPPGTSVSIVVGSLFSLSPGQPIAFQVAASSIYQVTKIEDTLDGSCDTDCSLREAIQSANGAPGVVLVPAGYFTLSRTGAGEDGGATGDLDVFNSMAIYGAASYSTVIDGNNADRIFDLGPFNQCCDTFMLSDLQVRLGRTAASSGSDSRGGGIRLGNSVSYIGFERLMVYGNHANESGGGIYLAAPGTIRESTLQGNIAAFAGGGLAYLGNPDKRLEFERGVFMGNDSGQGGGAQVQSSMRITNSTITLNRANANGGGINVQSNGDFALVSSTVMGNGAGVNPAQINAGAGIYLDSVGPNLIVNSVIARNRVEHPTDAPDCALSAGGLVSRYNHVQAPGSCMFNSIGDVTGSDPGLAYFPDYHGGPTVNYALLTGSAALNSADPAGCTDAVGLPLINDQRGAGYPRVVGATCDKGALESPLLTPPGVPILDAGSDSGISDSDRLTNVQLATFTGSCVDGTSVRIYAETPMLPTAICAGGSYSINLSTPLAEGVRNVSSDASNGPETSLRSDALIMTVDLTAPAPPTIAAPAVSVPFTVQISGTAAEGFGSILVSEGVAPLCTTAVCAPGVWSCAVTLSGVGAHALSAVHHDDAGNSSAPSTIFSVLISDLLLRNGFENP